MHTLVLAQVVRQGTEHDGVEVASYNESTLGDVTLIVLTADPSRVCGQSTFSR